MSYTKTLALRISKKTGLPFFDNEIILKAAEDFGYKKLVIAGGVSANTLLRRELDRECAERGLELYKPELKYCGDNGAMVGAQAYYEYLAGNIAELTLNAAATRSIELG